jgi:hypothetical protein
MKYSNQIFFFKYLTYIWKCPSLAGTSSDWNLHLAATPHVGHNTGTLKQFHITCFKQHSTNSHWETSQFCNKKGNIVMRGPIIVTSLTFIILSILVPIFVVFNNREAVRKRDVYLASQPIKIDDFEKEVFPNFNGLVLGGYNIKLIISYSTSVDTKLCIVRMHFDLIAAGTYASLLDSTVITNNVTLYYGNVQQINLVANRRLPGVDISVPLTDCNTNQYPFDHLSLELYIDAHTTVGDVVVPLIGIIYGGIQGYSITPSFIAHVDVIELSMDISRSWTTKAFSMFIIILMWLIGIGALLLTFTFIFFNFVEAPIMIVMTALLFALPNVRNLQPDIPSVGVSADVASFFWAMILVSCCEISLMVIFFINKCKKHLAMKKENKSAITV